MALLQNNNYAPAGFQPGSQRWNARKETTKPTRPHWSLHCVLSENAFVPFYGTATKQQCPGGIRTGVPEVDCEERYHYVNPNTPISTLEWSVKLFEGKVNPIKNAKSDKITDKQSRTKTVHHVCLSKKFTALHVHVHVHLSPDYSVEIPSCEAAVNKF